MNDLHLINMDQVIKVDVLRDVDADNQTPSPESGTFHVDIPEVRLRFFNPQDLSGN